MTSDYMIIYMKVNRLHLSSQRTLNYLEFLYFLASRPSFLGLLFALSDTSHAGHLRWLQRPIVMVHKFCS